MWPIIFHPVFSKATTSIRNHVRWGLRRSHFDFLEIGTPTKVPKWSPTLFKKLTWRSYPPLLLLRIGGSIHLHTTLALEIKAFAYAITRHNVPSNPKNATSEFEKRHKVVTIFEFERSSNFMTSST